MPASERAYHLRDMKKHQMTYEAACFYIVATSEKIVTSSRSSSSSTSTRIQQHDEDDDNKQLAVSNVLDVSNDFTMAEFKNILTHVQNLCQEMETGNKVINSQKDSLPTKQYQASKKRPNISTTSAATTLQQRMPVTTKRLKSKGSLSKDLASNATMELLLKAGKNQDASNDDIIYQYEDPFQKFQGQKLQKFLDWKKQVISMAIERTQKDIITSSVEENGTELDFLALDQAAREIIEKSTRITPTS